MNETIIGVVTKNYPYWEVCVGNSKDLVQGDVVKVREYIANKVAAAIRSGATNCTYSYTPLPYRTVINLC